MGDSNLYNFNVSADYENKDRKEIPINALWSGLREKTTAHGLPHITNAKGPIKRFIWITITVGMVGVLIYNIYLQVDFFLSYEVTVAVEMLHEPSLLFPAVTVCNMNPIKASALSESEVLRDILMPTETRKKRSLGVDCLDINQIDLETGICYGLYSETLRTSYNYATTACQDGHILGIIDSADKLNFLKNSGIVSGDGSPESYWHWHKANKTADFAESGTDWGAWDVGQPDWGDGVCPAAYATQGHKWRTQSCVTDIHHILCMKLKGCHVSPLPNAHTCYFLWDKTATYRRDDAKNLCELLGAKLAVLNTTDRINHVDNIGILENAQQTHYWIDLKKDNGTWKWEDSMDMTTNNWKNSADLSHDCVKVSKTTHKWESAPCDEMNLVLCEWETTETVIPTTTSTTTTTTTTTPSPVPSTVAKVEGSIYDRPQTRETFQREDKVIETIADMPIEEKVNIGYKRDEFILDCEYSGVTCFVAEMAHFYNPLHGNCYMFNSGWDNKTLVQSYRTGRRYGLKMVINIGLDEYISTIGESAGARVIVHPQEKMPFPEDEGLLVRPGELSSIGLRKITVSRQPTPYGDCYSANIHNKDLERDVYQETYEHTLYSKAGCYKTCYQRYVIDECGCADPNIPMAGIAFGNKKVSACSITNITQDDCKYHIGRLYNENELECDCPNNCTDNVFLPSVSTDIWPSEIHKDVILKPFEDKLQNLINSKADPYKYLKNVLKIEVYYEDFNYERIRESPAYSGGKFASDMGGILGLWVGCSVMSIFEFIEFFADVGLWICLQRKLKKEKKNQEKQNQDQKGKIKGNQVDPNSPPPPYKGTYPSNQGTGYWNGGR